MSADIFIGCFILLVECPWVLHLMLHYVVSMTAQTPLSLGPACGEYIVINHEDRFDRAAATAYIIFPVS